MLSMPWAARSWGTTLSAVPCCAATTRARRGTSSAARRARRRPGGLGGRRRVVSHHRGRSALEHRRGADLGPGRGGTTHAAGRRHRDRRHRRHRLERCRAHQRGPAHLACAGARSDRCHERSPPARPARYGWPPTRGSGAAPIPGRRSPTLFTGDVGPTARRLRLSGIFATEPPSPNAWGGTRIVRRRTTSEPEWARAQVRATADDGGAPPRARSSTRDRGPRHVTARAAGLRCWCR